jgi:peptide/nickel transport system substrate-binding protein
MKKVRTFFSLLLVLVFLASCAPTLAVAPATEPAATEAVGVPQRGGTFTYGITSDPPGFNPILNDSWNELIVMHFTSEPLTWGGENYPAEIRPILAESWETSADGKVWTIHLRHDVKWHDGTNFTADDVLFWAQAVQDPNDLDAQSWLGSRFSVGGVNFIYAKVDDYTITVTTDIPVPNLMGDTCVSLIQAKYFADHNVAPADMINEDYNTTANVGTGPFMFGEFKKGEAVILNKFADYWAGEPYLDSVVFRILPDAQTMITALETGEIDFANVDPKYVDELKAAGNLNIVTADSDALYQLRVNTSKPYLKDNRIRQALLYALDRESIIQSMRLGYGKVADAPFAPTISAYEALGGYGYDTAKAKELIEAVGWEMGPDGFYIAKNVDGVVPGTKFSITFDVRGGRSGDTSMSILLQSYWQAVGIDTQIRQIDTAAWTEENINQADKQYDVYFVSIVATGNNGLNYSWLMAAPDTTTSIMSYVNPDVNALFASAASSMDKTERDGYLKQAAAIIWDELPYIPLYLYTDVYAVNKRVHYEDAGFNEALLGIFENPEKLWVEAAR